MAVNAPALPTWHLHWLIDNKLERVIFILSINEDFTTYQFIYPPQSALLFFSRKSQVEHITTDKMQEK